MPTWLARDFTRDEVAALCGMPRNSLDSIIHRARDVAVLFTEKRKGRRWFSLRDVAVLRIAHEVERGGRSWLDAIGIAFEHTEDPPPIDAMLILTSAPVRRSGGPYVAHTLPDAVECSTLVVPIGRIVHEIKEAANVAI